MRDTETALAADLYIQATSNLDKAKLARKDAEETAINQVVAEFENIISMYNGTKYADLSLVQIGEAYMVRADNDDKYYNKALDSFDKLWSKYGAQPPTDTQVAKALKYAQNQINSISAYMKSQQIQRITGGGE